MNNRHFSEKELQVLTDISGWRFIAPPHISDVDELDEGEHRLWMSGNTHSHTYKEVLFVLSGEGLFGCSNKVYPLAAGSVFVLGSDTSHDLFYPHSCAPFEHLWMFLFRGRCVYHRMSREVTEGETVDKAGVFAHAENSRGAAMLYDTAMGEDRFKLQAAVSSLVYDVVRDGYDDVQDTAEFQGRVIDAICRHIQECAGRGATLDSLARISGYSKYHFLRLFKKHTNMSVHEYINFCRRQRVAQLNAQGLYKKEIAAELGFSCLAAYSRWLRSNPDI